jgi:hypothetical protein
MSLGSAFYGILAGRCISLICFRRAAEGILKSLAGFNFLERFISTKCNALPVCQRTKQPRIGQAKGGSNPI